MSLDALDEDVTQSTDVDNPLTNGPIGTLKNLAYMVIQTIYSASTDHCIVTEGRHHVLHIPTQLNGWDYGYYMMWSIQILVEEFIQEFRSLDFLSMTQIWTSKLLLSSMLVLISIVVQRIGSNTKMSHSFA